MKKYRSKKRWIFVLTCVSYLIDITKQDFIFEDFIFDVVWFAIGMALVMLGFMLLADSDD